MRRSLNLGGFVNAHRDRRVRLHQINGQSIFPVIAPSGGIYAGARVYFFAGFLDPIDLGRGGPVKHSHGHSWGFKLDSLAGGVDQAARVKDELTKFSQYLDEQGFQ